MCRPLGTVQIPRFYLSSDKNTCVSFDLIVDLDVVLRHCYAKFTLLFTCMCNLAPLVLKAIEAPQWLSLCIGVPEQALGRLASSRFGISCRR